MSEVDGSETLLFRIQVIRDQPLDERAARFAALHDELERRIDDGSGSPG